MRYEEKTEINAPLENVWSYLCRANEWPKWQPQITKVMGLETLSPGTEGDIIINGPFPLSAHIKVKEVVPNNLLMFSRNLPGLTTTTSYHLTPNKSGGTSMVSTIDVSGPVALLFGWLPGFGPSATTHRSVITTLKNVVEENK